MKELVKSIYAKNTGSALDTLIGGRIFYGHAPVNTPYPYVVFFRVAGRQDWTFVDKLDNPLIQFSVFSADAESSMECLGIADAIKALYDKCNLSVTGETFLYMWLMNVVGPMEDDSITQAGSDSGWACHLDFDVSTLT
jgi:hypothetical protein